MTQAEPKVSSSIDFSVDGKHHGHLNVPHSRNNSGWGAVRVPVVSIRNGDGPLLFLPVVITAMSMRARLH